MAEAFRTSQRTRPFHAIRRFATHPCTRNGIYARRLHTTTGTAAIASQPTRTAPRVALDGPAISSKTSPTRRDAVKNAKPFSDFLTDTFNRQHDYLRISITEKCNLRCLYCMPEEGVPQSPKKHLLNHWEIVRLASLFVSQGVTKIRLTGGEPTVNPHIEEIMQRIGDLRPQGLKELCLTTNGLMLANPKKLARMASYGLTGVNLSLDTLDPFQFEIMTRRRGFENVMRAIDNILEMNKEGHSIKLKVNCVVIRGLNDSQILNFVEMTRSKDVEVRFIEYMPFDGNKWASGKMLGYREMLSNIRDRFPTLEKAQDHPNDTSKTYKIPGFAGRLGFITSMTDHFCGTCNRLRMTADGNLKVCLFGNAEVSLRDMLRERFNGGEPLTMEVNAALEELERSRRDGVILPELDSRNMELLDIIGMAVKRKKAKHAGIGQLEHMKNRPMILIGQENLQPARPRAVPLHLLGHSYAMQHFRHASTSTKVASARPTSGQLTHLNQQGDAHMVHIPETRPKTTRRAIARAVLQFSNASTYRLIHNTYFPSSSPEEAQLKKGDVVAVTRVAGIMGAKKTADLIPLCHNIPISGVSVEIDVVSGGAGRLKGKVRWGMSEGPPSSTGTDSTGQLSAACEESEQIKRPEEEDVGHHGAIVITAKVHTQGQTGVEMEAMTAATVAALTAYDMCKAVDKAMVIGGARVLLKEGGKSGRWVEGIQAPQ